MLLHIIAIHPSAGEETRGYLHGGLFIDFVGQKAPVSRIRLVMFDALVMLVHLIMLGLVMERVRIDANRQTTQSEESSGTTATAATATEGANAEQDLDAEERGVMRDEQSNEVSSAAESSRESSVERTALLAEPDEDGLGSVSRDSHPLDTFASGEALILDMGLFETIRDQWRYNTGNRPRTAFAPSPETTTFLREHLGVSVGPDGRVVRLQR